MEIIFINFILTFTLLNYIKLKLLLLKTIKFNITFMILIEFFIINYKTYITNL